VTRLLGILLAFSLQTRPSEVATLSAPCKATAVALAKTGKLAAAICGDTKILLWSLQSGQLLRNFDLGGQLIDLIAVSDDGQWIVAGSHGGRYRVWNTSTGKQQMQLEMPYYPFALAFSSGGKRLAIAPAGQPVQIYDTALGKKLLGLQHPVGGTAAVVFSRDGGRLATADADTVVRVYDARTGEVLARNTDFLVVPLAVAFGADGAQVIAGGGDQLIAFLDTATGSVRHKTNKLVDPISYLEVSPDGSHVAGMLMHAANMLMPAPVVILETGSGRKVSEWMPPSLAIGGSWTTDGQLLVATSDEKTIHMWRVR
jgi:WD40 repeat protein